MIFPVSITVERLICSYLVEEISYTLNSGILFSLICFTFQRFTANTDIRTLIRNSLEPEITADTLAIHPMSWVSRPCLSVELIGCAAGMVTAKRGFLKKHLARGKRDQTTCQNCHKMLKHVSILKFEAYIL